MTLRQLIAIEKVADPWDLDTYIKQAMVCHLNGVHRPFWHDWPQTLLKFSPHSCFTTGTRCFGITMHNGVFVLLALLKLTSIFHPSPHTGFRQFPEDISNLKQVTG